MGAVWSIDTTVDPLDVFRRNLFSYSRKICKIWWDSASLTYLHVSFAWITDYLFIVIYIYLFIYIYLLVIYINIICFAVFVYKLQINWSSYENHKKNTTTWTKAYASMIHVNGNIAVNGEFLNPLTTTETETGKFWKTEIKLKRKKIKTVTEKLWICYV